MSETRITSLSEKLGLDLMERVAVKLGWEVKRNVTVQGQQCELSVQCPTGYYPIGFKQGESKTEVVRDDWRGYADADLATIMPKYKEGLFLETTHVAGFVQTNYFETKDEIVIRVAR